MSNGNKTECKYLLMTKSSQIHNVPKRHLNNVYMLYHTKEGCYWRTVVVK